MKLGVAIASLGLVTEGNAFVPSFSAQRAFVGRTVTSTVRPATQGTRHTRQVLKAVVAAPALATEVLTKVGIPRT